MSSFDYRRRASLLPVYLVIVMFPLLAWAQDNLSREQATRPMHVQKNIERFSNGKLKVEYSFYRGKDGVEVLHGKYITWSESGQKESSCNYLHGEKEGLCFWWNTQGKLADSVKYIHGKPRAIAEWEARDQRTVKTPIYLYPYIVVLPKGSLTFTSAYAGITKEFSLSELAEVVTSLPASVWVDGKSIGLEQIGVATEPDHQTMDQVTEKVTTSLAGLGYRVHHLPQ